MLSLVTLTNTINRYKSLTDISSTSNVVTISSRETSIRDFFKLLNRIDKSIHFEPSQLESSTTTFITEKQFFLVASEALDVFAASAPTDQARIVFAINVVSPVFNIPPNDLVVCITSDEPILDNRILEYVQVGRVKIPRREDFNSSSNNNGGTNSSFVSTPHSLRLMESCSASIVHTEPILLVGETGCGKTTVLQKLAVFAGRKLIVQNLSLSTDSTDLLGGYRPLEIKHIARPLYEEFLDIFCNDFSKKQNGPFLSTVAEAFQKKQFKKLSKCFRGAAKMGLKKVRDNKSNFQSIVKWEKFSMAAEKFERQRSAAESGLAFTFTEVPGERVKRASCSNTRRAPRGPSNTP